jgi:penicillin-binding protein 1C
MWLWRSGRTRACTRAGRGGRLGDTLRLGAASIAAAVLAGTAGYLVIEDQIRRLGPLPLERAGEASTVVLDRNGDLLRAFTTKDGRWRLPVSHDVVDERYLDLLIAFEDKRFRDHGGIDWRAFVRAGWQLLVNGRIVSGASTLTMQVARLLDERHGRAFLTKWRQMLRAVQLERHLGKDEILDLYLRLAPFGGNLEGVRAASLAYFGREPRRLSLGEAALLVALPQSPEGRRPDIPGNRASARAARARVLAQAEAAGLVSPAEVLRADGEAVPARRRTFAMDAAHLAEAVAGGNEGPSVHRLTIHLSLQRKLELAARRHVTALGPKLSAAVLVVDHASGEVLAHVGSAGYFDKRRFGAIDMVKAVRSPGSALKPIIYGLAFDAGIAHPETLIEDRPVQFGSYRPTNFDNEFRGTVTVREALARSLNIPAVKLLERVGPGRFLGRLERAGVTAALPPHTEPSLAVALGGLGVTLGDLTQTFAAIARGGEPVELRYTTNAESGRETAATRTATVGTDRSGRLLSGQAAYYIRRILGEAPPPPNARGGRIAFKTGTSYGYRDAWAIGFDGRHTVGVWVGRPDMVPSPGLLGRTAAAPLLFDAFQAIGSKRVPFRPAPAGVLKVASGADLPPPLKRFDEDGARAASNLFASRPVAIRFPPDRVAVEAAGRSALLLKADGGQLPLTWLVDGRPVGRSLHRREYLWRPEAGGFVAIAVVDAAGRADRVRVRLVDQ